MITANGHKNTNKNTIWQATFYIYGLEVLYVKKAEEDHLYKRKYRRCTTKLAMMVSTKKLHSTKKVANYTYNNIHAQLYPCSHCDQKGGNCRMQEMA